MRTILVLIAVVATVGLSGCGYNDIRRSDEATKSAWSEVINQYKRRADLIPNLVNTVKAFATQEQQVFIQVTALLALHFPPAGINPNELPDKPVVL